MPNLKITQQDIADALNISRATVSKVFNKKPISGRAKEIILKKAVELGYIDQKSGNFQDLPACDAPFGFILFICAPGEGSTTANASPAQFSQRLRDLILGMEQACRACNYGLIMSILIGQTGNIAKQLQDYAMIKIDGAVLFGVSPGAAGNFINSGDSAPPVVFIEEYDGNGDALMRNDVISFDCVSAMSAIIRRIADSGCKKIAYLSDKPNKNSEKCKLGFQYGCMENGIDAVVEYVDTGKLQWDAFVCENDKLAIELILEMKNHNRSVPEDVLVAGFDCGDEARALEYGLTTTLFNREDLGFKAIEQLVWRIRHPLGLPVAIRLQPIFAFRASTCRKTV